MTKENFINKWAFVYNVNDTTNPYFIADLEAVIAHEIAKAQEAKLKHADQVTDQVTDQPQPVLNPIEQAYERGEKIRMKEWPSNLWIMKHTKTEAIDELKNTYDVTNWAMKPHPEKWEIYTEPTEQPSSQVKLNNSFDKDRFEAMFRAVIETHEATMNALKQLDAYYATKEGGENE